MPTNSVYSVTFLSPTNHELLGIARREPEGEGLNIYLRSLYDDPDYTGVPNAEVAQAIILAGDYQTGLAILEAAKKAATEEGKQSHS